VKTKCLAILPYRLECCSFLKADIKSVYFLIMRILMNLASPFGRQTFFRPDRQVAAPAAKSAVSDRILSLHVAVAQSSFDCNAIRYVLSVLDNIMFSHNGAKVQNQRRCVYFVEFARWHHRVWGCCLRLQVCSKICCGMSTDTSVFCRLYWILHEAGLATGLPDMTVYIANGYMLERHVSSDVS